MRTSKKLVVLAAVAALALSALGVESRAQLTQPPVPPDWDPVFGTLLSAADDAVVTFPTPPATLAPAIPYFGTPYTSVEISTNGQVEFTGPGTGTAAFSGLDGLFDTRNIAAVLFGDWDPSVGPAGSGVYAKQRADGTLVVTWLVVPEYDPVGAGVNTFQAAFHPNGCIRFSYNGLTTDGWNWTGEPMIVGVSNRGSAAGSTQTYVATGAAALTSADGTSAINALDHSSIYLWYNAGRGVYELSDLPCDAVISDTFFYTDGVAGPGDDLYLFPRPDAGGGFILYGPTTVQSGPQEVGDVVCSGTGAIKNFAQVRVWFGVCKEDPTKVLTAFNRAGGPMTVYLRNQGRGPVTPTPPLVLASVDQDSALEQTFELMPRPLELKAQRSADGGFRFVAEGQPVQDLKVEIYSLSGKLVYDSGLVRGSSLRWAGLSNDGQRVANGVYLYVLKARDLSGRIVKTEVRKLVVLR